MLNMLHLSSPTLSNRKVCLYHNLVLRGIKPSLCWNVISHVGISCHDYRVKLSMTSDTYETVSQGDAGGKKTLCHVEFRL